MMINMGVIYFILGIIACRYFYKPSPLQATLGDNNIVTIPYLYKGIMYKLYIPYNAINVARGIHYHTPDGVSLQYHPGITSPITASEFGYPYFVSTSRGKETKIERI